MTGTIFGEHLLHVRAANATPSGMGAQAEALLLDKQPKHLVFWALPCPSIFRHLARPSTTSSRLRLTHGALGWWNRRDAEDAETEGEPPRRRGRRGHTRLDRGMHGNSRPEERGARVPSRHGDHRPGCPQVRSAARADRAGRSDVTQAVRSLLYATAGTHAKSPSCRARRNRADLPRLPGGAVRRPRPIRPGGSPAAGSFAGGPQLRAAPRRPRRRRRHCAGSPHGAAEPPCGERRFGAAAARRRAR
jgi:hypothetical protein